MSDVRLSGATIADTVPPTRFDLVTVTLLIPKTETQLLTAAAARGSAYEPGVELTLQDLICICARRGIHICAEHQRQDHAVAA